MEKLFLTEIIINNVRHLQNIKIELSCQEKKHLILTGKNGSGKTSLLMAILQYLQAGVKDRNLLQVEDWEREISRLDSLLENIRGNPTDPSTDFLNRQKTLSDLKRMRQPFEDLNMRFSAPDAAIVDAYHKSQYLITCLDAHRRLKLNPVKGIEKVDLPAVAEPQQNEAQKFLQYIVNMKANRAFASDDGENDEVQKIDQWFEHFLRILRRLFADQDLELQFDRKNYNFKIITENRNEFDFNQLSDGFSACLQIISELIMRMENNKTGAYDLQGLVLIDEIETHLHLELQKEILPMLSELFPNIQFIVTTHSPFVISSVENAVIYDLEKHFRAEGLSELP